MAEEQPPEVKAEAREFMSNLVGSGPSPNDFNGGDGIDMAAWKATYASSAKDDALMEKFWSVYDPSSTSIWTMVYDEADSNENLDDTVEIVKEFMSKTESIKDHCFGVMHILGEGLEIEGLWVFNGEDPEELFGANEDTSWYSWSQIGPDATDLVKKAVTGFLAPTDGKLDGKAIRNTQAFC
uniref:EF-1-gamma C-terminal domain-containing protein n=1 Tax=Minutocellus polymorphus TaxID=265543 RepID=A0A6U0J384_9STRA|mmetsp:Transcript_16032/g.26729  ORF Transcript_16032/g.26729 Transcript_16032/m.26729 type:complete len:182 (+) Transcript_16032:44-589(+)